MTNDASDIAGVVGTLRQDAIAFGQLVLMAYKMSGQGLTPPLPSDFPANYQIVKNVIMDDYGTPTFYGFIAHSAPSNSYVLVIRGTLSMSEWFIDLQSMFPVPFYTYGSVGSGFAQTYKTIYLGPTHPVATTPQVAASVPVGATARPFAAQVADALQTHAAAIAGAAQPAPRLALVGHSLGSALVTLYAVERLVYPSLPIDRFYTFASPLVGDPAFGSAFDSLRLPVTHRIFDNWDPVPKLPPLSGYAPVGTAQEIDLNKAYYGLNPFCAHSMDTYLNYFDPSHPPAAVCTSLIPLAMTMVAATAPARAAMVAAQATAATVPAAVAPVPAALAPAASIKHGTTITITIETGGG